MEKPIKIKANGIFKNYDGSEAEQECDDAIIILSEILREKGNGSADAPRNVKVWAGGFDSETEMRTRVAQATVQIFMDVSDREKGKRNIIDIIRFLINNSDLSEDVKLHVSKRYENIAEGRNI